MTKPNFFSIAAIAALSSCAISATLVADGAAQATQTPKQETHVSPIPATPASIREIVLVRPFTLERSYPHEFRKERPAVEAGLIVVIRADSELLRPRQVAQPVLMIGTQVVEPMNIGYASGTLVAIVPAPKKADGTVDLDLTKTPIYFGQPDLPETIDQTWADAQLRLADLSGMKAVSADAARTALERGGAIAKFADREALDRAIGALVRVYAADETDRADQLEGKTDPTPRPVR